MKLLVGIPSFRRPDMLAALLESLARLDQPEGATIEIFVADNDPAAAAGAALCARIGDGYRWPLDAATVTESGISAARNRILDEAERRGADMLAMIDDDETASPQWLARLDAARREHGAEVIGGAVLFAFDEPISHALAQSGAFIPKQRPSGRMAMLNATSNVLFDCAALARLGWPRFDHGFGLTGGGDKEYFTRLKLAGLRFAWAADAIVHETIPPARTRTRAVLRRAYGIGNSDYRIAARHGSARARAAHLAKSVAVLAAAVPLAPVLLVPRYRLWLLRRHARALGRLAAAFGVSRAHYGATISP